MSLAGFAVFEQQLHAHLRHAQGQRCLAGVNRDGVWPVPGPELVEKRELIAIE
jgi:hypothetical protein